MHNNTQTIDMSFAGHLIMTPPKIKDAFWQKSVVLIVDHDQQGAVGIKINQPSDMKISEFGAKLNIKLNYTGNVYIGGHYKTSNMSFIHTNDWQGQNTLRINDDISLTSDETVLTRLARGDAPAHWRLLMGIVTWAPQQLEQEILGLTPQGHDGSWCWTSYRQELLFGVTGNVQWKKCLAASGQEFTRVFLNTLLGDK